MNIELLEDGVLPQYAHQADACMDCFSREDVEWEYEHGVQTATMPLGFKIEIPRGYALLLFSRSGMGFRDNISLANSVGVIDCGFTGEVKVKLIKHSITMDCKEPIQKGDKVCQMALFRRPKIYLNKVDKLEPNERGVNGFGSTGR